MQISGDGNDTDSRTNDFTMARILIRSALEADEGNGETIHVYLRGRLRAQWQNIRWDYDLGY